MLDFKSIVTLIRAKHWVKNILIFLPSFFAGTILVWSDIVQLCLTFVSFSIAASFIYILNDIVDLELDRNHPHKKYRPIPSGKVSLRNAKIIMVICFVFLLVSLIILHNFIVAIIIFSYLLMNILYCLIFKNISILDVLFVASGFIIRLFSGGMTVDIQPSQWLILMIFLLATLIVLGKRRDDIIISLRNSKTIKKFRPGYNLQFIDYSIVLMAGISLFCYIMYSISLETIIRLKSEKIYLTSIFVLMGILRYFQIIFVEEKSGSPVKILLSDRFIQGVIFLWTSSFAFIIYY